MNKKGDRKEAANYLDFIPAYQPAIQWKAEAQGKITIYMENKGVFHWLAQKLLKKPEVSQIHLDEMGSFIWSLIDGKRSVYEIGGKVKEKFGEKAEPLYERLVMYMHNLESYGFIQMKSGEQ